MAMVSLRFSVPIEPASGITTRAPKAEAVPETVAEWQARTGGKVEVLAGPSCLPAWMGRAA